MKLAPEGWPFVAAFVVLTAVVFFFFGRWPALLPLVLTLFMVYFFRDPDRTPASLEGYLAPADGRVIVVKETFEGTHLKKDALMISIFMSPFNVHVNRAPCKGSVAGVFHTPGKFSAAYKDEASIHNENTVMLLKCGQDDTLLVRQVAGFVARRTVCRVKPGDSLERGQRYGMIKFSSRLDVYLPKGTVPAVKLGDRVKAGETVIAAAPEEAQ